MNSDLFKKKVRDLLRLRASLSEQIVAVDGQLARLQKNCEHVWVDRFDEGGIVYAVCTDCGKTEGMDRADGGAL